MDSTNNSKKTAAIIVLVLIVAVFAFIFVKDKYPNLLKWNFGSSGPAIPEVSQEDRKKAVDSVVVQAKAGLEIDVTGCKPSPSVLSFPLGSKVTFRNKDNVYHEISFSPSLKFRIPAKTSVRVPFDSYKFPGVRKYTCDGAPAGSVVIE